LYSNRLNSNRVAGSMQVKIGVKSKWVKKWVVFDEGMIKYSDEPHSPDNEVVSIPMDHVVSLRADVRI
jgi:hypothetical protein